MIGDVVSDAILPVISDLEHKMDRRFDEIEGKTNSRFDQVDARFDRMEGRLDTVERKVDRVIDNQIGDRNKLEDHEKRIKKLESARA